MSHEPEIVQVIWLSMLHQVMPSCHHCGGYTTAIFDLAEVQTRQRARL